MHIHAKNSDIAAADELFAEMKNSSVQLTERFYGYYLPLFSHDREKFHNVRTEARSLGFRMSFVWDQLVTSLLRFGDYQAALETYVSLRPEARRFEINVFDRLVQTLRREGNADSIAELYKLEQDLGTQVPPLQMVDVVWALGQRGEYQSAIAAFESCWKATKEKDAAAFLPRSSRTVDVVLFRQVLDLCVRQRDIESALRFYEMVHL